ncbi:hypothetical protein XELAEV_18001495mg [Xenopus laevis]|nr:hypothetical protein XELAEV_18001495mg [Xenopus laevis]
MVGERVQESHRSDRCRYQRTEPQKHKDRFRHHYDSSIRASHSVTGRKRFYPAPHTNNPLPSVLTYDRNNSATIFHRIQGQHTSSSGPGTRARTARGGDKKREGVTE